MVDGPAPPVILTNVKLMKQVLFNWSGGKDSAMALHRLRQKGRFEIAALLTSFNSANNRVSMHGIRRELIEEQVRQMGLDLHPLMLPEHTGMEAYNALMEQTLTSYKKKEIRTCVFGDIFLEDLKTYRERQLHKIRMEAIFPLWQQSTDRLAQQFIEEGFRAVVVAVNGNKLDRSFAGREYDETFLSDLPREVDPCGEYGAFHTFVYDGPIFDAPVPFERGEVVSKSYTPTEEDKTHNFADERLSEQEVHYYYQDLTVPEAVH